MPKYPTKASTSGESLPTTGGAQPEVLTTDRDATVILEDICMQMRLMCLYLSGISGESFTPDDLEEF